MFPIDVVLVDTYLYCSSAGRKMYNSEHDSNYIKAILCMYVLNFLLIFVNVS